MLIGHIGWPKVWFPLLREVSIVHELSEAIGSCGPPYSPALYFPRHVRGDTSVGTNLTPESRDPDLLAILGSTWWDPDLLVTDLDPEKDPDPPGDPDLFDNFLPNFFTNLSKSHSFSHPRASLYLVWLKLLYSSVRIVLEV